MAAFAIKLSQFKKGGRMLWRDSGGFKEVEARGFKVLMTLVQAGACEPELRIVRSGFDLNGNIDDLLVKVAMACGERGQEKHQKESTHRLETSESERAIKWKMRKLLGLLILNELSGLGGEGRFDLFGLRREF